MNFVADFKEQEQNTFVMEKSKRGRIFGAWKRVAAEKRGGESECSEDDEFENEVEELVIEFRKVNFHFSFEKYFFDFSYRKYQFLNFSYRNFFLIF